MTLSFACLTCCLAAVPPDISSAPRSPVYPIRPPAGPQFGQEVFCMARPPSESVCGVLGAFSGFAQHGPPRGFWRANLVQGCRGKPPRSLDASRCEGGAEHRAQVSLADPAPTLFQVAPRVDFQSIGRHAALQGRCSQQCWRKQRHGAARFSICPGPLFVRGVGRQMVRRDRCRHARRWGNP